MTSIHGLLSKSRRGRYLHWEDDLIWSAGNNRSAVGTPDRTQEPLPAARQDAGASAEAIPEAFTQRFRHVRKTLTDDQRL